MSTLQKLAALGGLCAAFVAYSAYVYTAGTRVPQPVALTDSVHDGYRLFQQHNCIACHQFYGLGGYMGPDLTNVISNRGEAYAGAFITAGTASMPNLGLSSNEVSDVVAYLGFVDNTGTYPPENYEVTWFGTVRQEDDPH